MPSPVGHILGGAAVYLAGTRRESRSSRMVTIAFLGSVLPDFDFLPGILIGEMGAFHHGISHSLAFSVLFGAIVFLFFRRIDQAVAIRASMLAMLAYAVHVVLDFVGVNEGTQGVPIFWPLSTERFGIDLNLFGHFRWSDIRDGIGAIVRWDNVMTLLREVLIGGGAVFLLLWRDRRSVRKSKL